MNTVTIQFPNGTQLTAEQNGSCYIVDTKPAFPDDLSVVEVMGDEPKVFHNAFVQDCASVDGRYWFAFVEKTQDELFRQQMQEDMASIEDALCEQDAATDERLAAIEDALCEMDKEE